ncbi:MAG: CRTAC1 family protein [Acidobacteria bacterium]|nr:CRTAC1 family protein [Acidobacteriota bacterium]
MTRRIYRAATGRERCSGIADQRATAPFRSRLCLRFAFIALILSISVAPSRAQGPGAIRFAEIGEKAGVRHVHQTRKFKGAHGDVLGMFTSGGSSVAVGDFDNDGWDDMFVTSSDEGKFNKLFRNSHNGTFEDVTEEAGEVAHGNDPLSIVSDALWFDYDNDGWRDLLVVRFGTPLLYHNEKGDSFTDVSTGSGLNKFANTIAAISIDYDRDGDLDLLFGNYFKPENLLALKDPKVLPNNLDDAINGGGLTLWRNDGAGKFSDATARAGFENHTGWTLDVGAGDFDNDGDPDVYVASDYGMDRVYLNNGDGTYKDVSATAIGKDTKKGMNAEVADYDNDGWLDVYVTNITDEYMKECNMLWHNDGNWATGNGTFTDLSKETGSCDTLWGWGAKFADFDNDGWLDLFATNGLRSGSKENYVPLIFEMLIKPGVDFSDVSSWPAIGDRTWSGYQKKKLMRNLDGQAFKDISAAAGVDNEFDGRGVAIADFDNDGRLDFYQTNADQPALMYHNETTAARNWVAVQLVGTKSNRDAIGARITLKADGREWIREVDGGNGYSGQSTQRVHYGLGAISKIDSVEILWPSGAKQKVSVPMNQISTIHEDKGVISK